VPDVVCLDAARISLRGEMSRRCLYQMVPIMPSHRFMLIVLCLYSLTRQVWFIPLADVRGVCR